MQPSGNRPKGQCSGVNQLSLVVGLASMAVGVGRIVAGLGGSVHTERQRLRYLTTQAQTRSAGLGERGRAEEKLTMVLLSSSS